MKKRKLLICGATGFIGRNLTEYFARLPQYEVHAVRFMRPAYACAGVTWYQADLRRTQDIARIVAGADVLIQAAAITSGVRDTAKRPYIHVTDNAVMNSLLLRQAFESRVGHFVFFSCAVMLTSAPAPLAEDDWDANVPLHPRYFGAGWTKIYVEKMCEFYASLGVTKHTAIRHSNIYGPHDKFDLEHSHVFGATVTKAMTAADGKLLVWGAGKEARDLLYVDDLVDFVARVIERQAAPFALYNCGYGETIAVKDLVERLVAASGRELAIEHDLTRPSIETSLSLDCSKAARDLGWRRTVPLDDGIARTISWWKEHVAGSMRQPSR